MEVFCIFIGPIVSKVGKDLLGLNMLIVGVSLFVYSAAATKANISRQQK